MYQQNYSGLERKRDELQLSIDELDLIKKDFKKRKLDYKRLIKEIAEDEEGLKKIQTKLNGRKCL